MYKLNPFGFAAVVEEHGMKYAWLVQLVYDIVVLNFSILMKIGLYFCKLTNYNPRLLWMIFLDNLKRVLKSNSMHRDEVIWANISVKGFA